jgi:hypothetical protein
LERGRTFQPGIAVAVREAQVLQTQREQIAPRALEQRLDPLDRVHLGEDVRQHRRLVAAAGAHLERFSRGFSGNQLFDHFGYHVRLRDGLAEADRQRGVVVGAAGKRFLDEKMPWHCSHRGEHALVADPLVA